MSCYRLESPIVVLPLIFWYFRLLDAVDTHGVDVLVLATQGLDHLARQSSGGGDGFLVVEMHLLIYPSLLIDRVFPVLNYLPLVTDHHSLFFAPLRLCERPPPPLFSRQDAKDAKHLSILPGASSS